MFLGSEITKEFLEGAVPLNESDDTDRDAILETEIYRAISGKAKYMSMIDLLENILHYVRKEAGRLQSWWLGQARYLARWTLSR